MRSRLPRLVRLLPIALLLMIALPIPATLPILSLPAALVPAHPAPQPTFRPTIDQAPRLWLPAALPITLVSSTGPLGDLRTPLDRLYTWPVAGPIVHPFDPPAQPWLRGHRGVDIEAPESSLVRAASGGVVWFAGFVASRPLVSIAHPNGTRTTYEPVRPLVSAGDPVSAGDIIGILLAGHPGCARACLHWGLRHGDTYLDPLSLLGLGRVRLLPASPSVRAL